MGIINDSKKLFTARELRELGFEVEMEGGFQYLTKGNLVTGDVGDDEPIQDEDVFRVYVLGMESMQLTYGKIQELLKEGSDE